MPIKVNIFTFHICLFNHNQMVKDSCGKEQEWLENGKYVHLHLL